MLSQFARKRYQILLVLVFCWIFLTAIRDSFDRKNCYPLSSHDSRSTANTVRICCLIITRPTDLSIRARAVHETWGPRCDRHFFVVENFTNDNITSEQIDFIQQLPILSAGNTSTGDRHLLQKVNVALLSAHEHYINDFDWFVKADDDTYIIVDNLRAFLAKQNATEPVTFGYHFKVNHSERRKPIVWNVLGDGERWLSFGWRIVCVKSRIIETIPSRSSDPE